MSMKRTKQRTGAAGRNSDPVDVWAKPQAPEREWAEVEAQPDDAFVDFVLASRYAKGDFIRHSKFGKGLVLGVEGARIEVLFHDGKKKLGHTVS